MHVLKFCCCFDVWEGLRTYRYLACSWNEPKSGWVFECLFLFIGSLCVVQIAGDLHFAARHNDIRLCQRLLLVGGARSSNTLSGYVSKFKSRWRRRLSWQYSYSRGKIWVKKMGLLKRVAPAHRKWRKASSLVKRPHEQERDCDPKKVHRSPARIRNRYGFVAQWLKCPRPNRKTLDRILAGFFLSDPASVGSSFVCQWKVREYELEWSQPERVNPLRAIHTWIRRTRRIRLHKKGWFSICQVWQ